LVGCDGADYIGAALEKGGKPRVIPARIAREEPEHCLRDRLAIWALRLHFLVVTMIRKLKSGEYRLYSRKMHPRTGRRRNLGTFGTRAAAEKHERAIQYFKRH
jgi:hypothetical protein